MSKGASAEELRTQLQAIDPYEFEDFVAELWEAEGWQTSVSQGSNDKGVDVVAEKTGTIDQKLVIQAKRYSDGNKVGRPKIQQYHSLKEQDTDADAAVVVTTSEFTDKARLWAYDHNVKLVDGDDLVEMVRKHGMEDVVSEYMPDKTSDQPSSPDTGTSESTPSSSSTSATDVTVKTGLAVFVVIVGYGFGLAGMFAPEAAPYGSGVGAAVFGVSFLATAPVIFADALALHRLENPKWKPNRLLWPVAGLMLGPLALIAYFLSRN